MLFMWEDAKQHHVTRSYLIFLRKGLITFGPGVVEWGPPADQMRHTSGKGFTPCAFHSMGAVPQCLLCGDL